MIKNLLLLLITFFSLYNIKTEEIINIKTKVAKIGNELILKSDIEKYAGYFKISEAESKNILINNAILITGARAYAKEPTDQEIDEYIKTQKNIYAGKIGKEAKNVSDAEFLSYLNFSGVTLVSYKIEIKKNIWINNYLDAVAANKNSSAYAPTEEEINNILKNKKELFQEKEGVFFSMIYFSFYDENGIFKSKKERENLQKKAQQCLNELNIGENFDNQVEKYSEDLISKKNTPKGKVGFMAFDDPRTLNNFSEYIINELKKSNEGIVKKVFNTKNGLLIIRIDEKVKAKTLLPEEAKLKAETLLVKEYERNYREIIKKNLIKDLSGKIEIIYY